VPSEVDVPDSMRDGNTFVYGDCIGDTAPRIQLDAGGAAPCVQEKHGLDGDVESACVERLEHYLSRLLAVKFRVDRGLGQEDGVGCSSGATRSSL
jgi:hypothetical protein